MAIENPDGAVVRVIVEDDGPGVAAEHANRLFEPFFTTKTDVGNGLGLWVAKEIIERHRGVIRLHSQSEGSLGEATFTIEIPCESSSYSLAGS